MTTINRIIYLDFDGVLHPTSPVMDGLFSRAHLLEDLFTKMQSEVFIVVSSSWRFTHNLEKLQRIIPTYISSLIVVVTGAPVIGKHPRFTEITNFLKSNVEIDWKALDDSYWEFPNPCPQLVRCNPNTGITDKQITEIRQWLSS